MILSEKSTLETSVLMLLTVPLIVFEEAGNASSLTSSFAIFSRGEDFTLRFGGLESNFQGYLVEQTDGCVVAFDS
jgi:hypothetical protein